MRSRLSVVCYVIQMQGLASGVGTVLGTCVRIPCEVLKQRLQVCAALRYLCPYPC